MSNSKELAAQLSAEYGIEISSAEVDENGLYKITISGKEEEVPDRRFACNEKISEVVIEEGVKRIGEGAFCDCVRLTSVTIENGVTDIDIKAFCGCRGLTNIKIPDSVTNIGELAFLGCYGFKIPKLPDNITNINDWCIPVENLEDVEIEKGVYYSGKWALECDESVKCLVLREGTIGIAGGAFSANEELERAQLPNSLIYICEHAFDGCENLEKVNLPNSVTYIGDSAFEGCYSLEIVNLPDSLTYIGDNAISDCNWQFDEIPDNVKEMGEDALGCYTDKIKGVLYFDDWAVGVDESGMAGESEIELRKGTCGIANGAFDSCSPTRVELPAAVRSFGMQKFSRQILKSIYVNQNNAVYKSVGNCLIETKSKTLVVGCANSVIPDDGSVTSIGDYAFYNSGLTSITIPDSVTSIGACAFEGCSRLTSITIPDSVTSIHDSAFEGCSGLTSITIPDSVTSIHDFAFEGCSGLTNIKFGAGVNFFSWRVLFGCRNLKDITIDESNPKYCSRGDCLINKITKTLIQGYNVSIIPDDGSVIRIAKRAFDGAVLTAVSIPKCVVEIQYGAFFGMYNQIEVILVDDANPVYHSNGNCLIDTCSKTLLLGCKDSIVPNDGSVTRIGDYAFYGCTDLTSITIPDSVTSIGGEAFSGCRLRTVNFQGTMAQWRAIKKDWHWNFNTGKYTVHCTDGTISKAYA